MGSSSELAYSQSLTLPSLPSFMVLDHRRRTRATAPLPALLLSAATASAGEKTHGLKRCLALSDHSPEREGIGLPGPSSLARRRTLLPLLESPPLRPVVDGPAGVLVLDWTEVRHGDRSAVADVGPSVL